MSMYGAYPKVKINGVLVEQNGLNGAPKAWPTTDCSKDPILTVQAPREEVNINSIMKRIEKGQLVDAGPGEQVFQDISEFEGLEDARIKVQKANDDFMSLPADLRSRFHNDPVELVAFLADGNNRKEAVELGLVKESEIAPPVPIPPVEGEKKPA